MPRFTVIAFDADDTLWHNERLYAAAQARFKHLLAHYHDPQWIEERLYEAEMRNLPHFGYGIKSFALSMIETAVELTEGRVSGQDILTLVETAKQMLTADVELLDHVAATVRTLAATHTLMIITKGDLLDQESKVARSGLATYFDHIEIVSEKTPDSYAAVLRRRGISADGFLMVGNSLRSDILPALALGAQAVYVPYALTWAHEVVEPPPADHPGFHEIAHLGLLPDLVRVLEGA